MSTRIPKKVNSIEKKERLAETCFYLICENGFQNINSSIICDRAKVSVGTFYAYYKDINDIIEYSLKKYSLPILFPIHNNLNLLKFNKNTITKTINKMFNISLEVHTMTNKSHQNILSVIYSNQNYLNFHKKSFDNEVEAIYQKCLQNGFKEENLKETIHTTLILIESFVHDKTFNKSSYIDYEKQKLFITQTLLRLWSLHI